MRPVIVLVTDFGVLAPYVGQMKEVIEFAVSQGRCARLLELRPGDQLRLAEKDTLCP